MNTTTTKPMIITTIKEFVTFKGFKQLSPKVRTNTNGYPFITFIDATNKAENVYFSKSASKLVSDDLVITKELLSTLSIGYTTNEKGEARIKLISNSERLELSSLLD